MTDYQARLNALYQRIHDAEALDEVLPVVEREVLAALAAERVTVYQWRPSQQALVSSFKSGSDLREIRVPLTTSSIAGFVGLAKASVRINDVYDSKALQAIHPKLQFDKSFDGRSGYRTHSMLVVPILFNEVLLGVLQVINHVGGTGFAASDMARAQELARVIGQKLRYDVHGTKGPYEYLIQTKRLSKERLEEIRIRAKQENISVSQVLMSEYKLRADEIGKSLERYFQIPYMAFDPSIEPPRELLKGLSEEYLRFQRWVPIEGNLEEAVVLLDEGSEQARMLEVQRVLKARRFAFRVALADDLNRYLDMAFGRLDNDTSLQDIIERLKAEVVFESAEQHENIVDENESAVIKLVNDIIIVATQENASDIHIEPGKGNEPTSVRMRIDGECRVMLDVPAAMTASVIARIKIIARLNIAERRLPQDGKCVVRIHGRSVEIRVATLPTVNGEAAVLRILSAGTAMALDDIGLSVRNLRKVDEILAQPFGLFLVVGPTGSGKTTTLHAMLSHINTPERKIWTAEDPVEITQKGLQQVQINPKIGFSFAEALRSFLRADPDVIMIGEIRDRETAQIAIEASLTGHMVFSTLHTNSAPETVTRLLDLGVDAVNFSDALVGVVAQRLVRRLCDQCKEGYEPSQQEYEQIVFRYGADAFSELQVDRSGLTLYRPRGCEACSGVGYRGRIAVHELLHATRDIKQMIAQRSNALQLRFKAVQDGMRGLMQDGVIKVLHGETDMGQLVRVVGE